MIFMNSGFFRILRHGLLFLGLLTWFAAGCDVSSPDSVSNDIIDSDGTKVDFTGRYMNSGLTCIVSPANSGEAIWWMQLMQSGSILEGYDNNGSDWKGKISKMENKVASFSMSGYTTAGNHVDMNGNLDASSGETATMQGVWIEPSISAQILASAYVTISSNTPAPDLVITPTNNPVILTNASISSQFFSISGGDPEYRWEISNGSLGSVNPVRASSTTYTKVSGQTGTNTITVYDSAGRSKSTTIVQ